MKKYLLFGFLIVNFTTPLFPDENSTQTVGAHDQKKNAGNRIVNKDPRLVFLLKISGQKREEIEVKQKEIAGQRVCERHESKFPIYNKTTKTTVKIAKQVLDITEINGKFMGRPRRALKVGSVVPGSWLGDNSGQNYILTDQGERYVDRFEATTRAVGYTMLLMYDTYCEEVSYDSDDAIINPH